MSASLVRSGPALRLSYGHGTHGSASCYVKHRDKRTWVLVQERLKVVPLTAYSPVARGRRVKRHTRRPNGLELLVLCCCSRSRSRHERRVTSSALAHRRLRTTQLKVVATRVRSAANRGGGNHGTSSMHIHWTPPRWRLLAGRPHHAKPHEMNPMLRAKSGPGPPRGPPGRFNRQWVAALTWLGLGLGLGFGLGLGLGFWG